MMDTSKEYIKMCEKSSDLQRLFNPKETSFLWDGVLRNSDLYDSREYKGYRELNFKFKDMDITGHHIWLSYDGYEASAIWLPRQDQLQEMVEWRDITLVGRCRRFVGEITTRRSKIVEAPMRKADGSPNYLGEPTHIEFSYPYEQFVSMEQLWLAFVMAELHKKKWNGEEWVKAGLLQK